MLSLRTGLRWCSLGVALVVFGSSAGASRAGASVVVPRPTGSWIVPEVVPGDFNRDGGTDVALVGSLTPATAWPSFPVALSRADGTFAVSDAPSASFAGLASAVAAERLTGDFNGDGRTDIAAMCGCGWTTVPVAFSTGDGGFTETNKPAASFAALYGVSGARAVTGDFNHDARTDIALVGGFLWTTVPVALSKGDGSFTVTNVAQPIFTRAAQRPGIRVLTGDFNNDGRTDLALVGGSGATSVPVALSNGDGSFTATNAYLPDFAGWAQVSGAKPVTGDFDHDGRTDIALVGGVGWSSIPVAFSGGDGTFHVTNGDVGAFGAWAQESRVVVVPGDYNHDGLVDFALTAGTGWTSIPVAFSTGNGGFTVTNTSVPDFPALAQETGAHVVPGDFNRDGRADLALVGAVDRATQPVAFSAGNGGFTVTNAQTPLFARWAQADATMIGTAIPAPSLDAVQVAGTNVTVRWTDRSPNEDAFTVLRRDPASGQIRFRTDVPSTTRSGTGQTYAFTDAVPAGSRQCYEIAAYNYQASSGVNFSNEQCTTPVTLPSPPPVGDGIISTPDTNGVTGVRSSVAVGRDGLGVMSYYVGGGDCSACNLRVAHCVDTDCTAVTTHDVDTIGDVGLYSSIKIGSDGLPLVSYTSYRSADFHFTEDLKVAHCEDVECSSATVTTLDAAATVNAQTSLTIGADGLGLIAYQDNPPSGSVTNVKLAHCLDVACTSARRTTADTVGQSNGGFDPGIVAVTASPTGVAYLAYRDSAQHQLKLDVCRESNCVFPQEFSLDSSSAGLSPSITMGRDGLPLLSYMGNYTASGSDLVVAHCVNVYCTGVTRALVHTGVFTGWWGSIAIGADGLGVVAYTDATNQNVEVAHCENVACTTLQRTVIDEFDNQGHGADSIAIGADGLPLITYLDLTNDVLKVAHCADVACAVPLGAPFLTGHPSKASP
jgi:FG-GAP-like repeat